MLQRWKRRLRKDDASTASNTLPRHHQYNITTNNNSHQHQHQHQQYNETVSSASSVSSVSSASSAASSSSLKAPSQRKARHHQSCNSFLLGGTHYPGKDKKRRRGVCRPSGRGLRCRSAAVYVVAAVVCLSSATRLYRTAYDGNDRPGSDPVIRTLHNTYLHGVESKCPSVPSPPSPSSSYSTTLVLQTTLDRLPLLKETCHRWSADPIIAVVYLPSSSSDRRIRRHERLRRHEPPDLRLWNELLSTYRSACPGATLLPYRSASPTERSAAYPVNAMRNVGLDAVGTSHVLVVDVDFVPSAELDSRVREVLAKMVAAAGGGVSGGGDGERRDAIVVPAWERKLPGCTSVEGCRSVLEHHKAGEDGGGEGLDYVPRTMDELTECYYNSLGAEEEDSCTVFQSDVNPEGHSTTRSKEWLADGYPTFLYGDEEEDKTEWSTPRLVPCFDSNRYEPYVVVPWCPTTTSATTAHPTPVSPYYDERFYGYGKNKIQQIAHLRAKGYRFSVLPPVGFLTHHPHPVSEVKEVWNDRTKRGSGGGGGGGGSGGGGNGGIAVDLHTEMDRLYPKYLEELGRVYSYGDASWRTPICSKKDRTRARTYR